MLGKCLDVVDSLKSQMGNPIKYKTVFLIWGLTGIKRTYYSKVRWKMFKLFLTSNE